MVAECLLLRLSCNVGDDGIGQANDSLGNLHSIHQWSQIYVI